MGVLKDRGSGSDRKLFWEYQENYAMRDGKWKLVQSNLDKQWELYDIEADRGETNDLAGTYPERVKRMIVEWKTWHETVSRHGEVN